ncbi:MAG: ATP-binding cassette domain-containing protein [Luteolibacter sp.]
MPNPLLSLSPTLTPNDAHTLVDAILEQAPLDHPAVDCDLFLGRFSTRLHPYRLGDPRLALRAVRLNGEWLVCHFCPEEIPVTCGEGLSLPPRTIRRLEDRESLSLPPHHIDRESLELAAGWRDEMPVVRSLDAQGEDLILSSVCQPEHHALLRYDQGFSIAPLPGRSLLVNGTPVADTTSIFPSDTVEIGRFRSRAYELIHRVHEPSSTLVLEKITKRFPDGALGLQDVSLSLQSGDFVAVMGPSGSGKSTFLDVITGSPITSGTIRADDFKGRIATVPQDDVLFETLSVEENLLHAARLRTRLSPEEIAAKIDEILPLIGLEEKRHLRAGSDLDRTLSGGQRRRLSIGLELMGNPRLLILDEPTSGLSGPDAASVVELLRGLARRGALVIATIHQPAPETFARFDKLIVLDRGGVLAFFGYASEAARYFAGPDASGAEPVLGTIMKSTRPPGKVAEVRLYEPSHWGALYEENRHRLRPPLILNEESPTHASAPAGHGWLHQFLTITRREISRRLKDWRGIVQSLVLAAALGALIAIVCRQGEPYRFASNKIVASYAFLAIILSQFLAASAAVGELVKDRRKQQREKQLEIEGGIYVLSKLPFLFLLTILQAGIISWTGYQLLAIPFGFYPFWGILSLAGVAATALGLVISALPKMTEMKAMSAVPLLLIPQIVLAGADPFAFQDMKHLNRPFSTAAKAPWFTVPVPSRWAYEGAIHAWTDIPGQKELDIAKNDRATLNFFKRFRKLFFENRAEFDARYQERFGKPFDHAAMTRNIALLARFGILQPNDVNRTYALDYHRIAPRGSDLAAAQNTTLSQHASTVVSKNSSPHLALGIITAAASLLALLMNRLSLGQPLLPSLPRLASGRSVSSANLAETPTLTVVVVTPETYDLLNRHLDLSRHSVFRAEDDLPAHCLACVEKVIDLRTDAAIRTFHLPTLLARIAARRIALPLQRGNAQQPLEFTLDVDPDWSDALVAQIQQIGQSLQQDDGWHGLPPLIHLDGEPSGTHVTLRRDMPRIRDFLEELLSHELNPQSACEKLARQIHIEYCRVEAADRRSENHSPAIGQTWESLDETHREYSRDSATHLLASAQGLGFRISPERLTPCRDPELLKSLAAHLEELAACEHYRWMASRVLNGWSYGNPRDDVAKRHPDLLAYHELSEPTREKDRACVRALAVILQRGIMHAS